MRNKGNDKANNAYMQAKAKKGGWKIPAPLRGTFS
jgi:hypothetical protein